jgi:exonuclease III
MMQRGIMAFLALLCFTGIFSQNTARVMFYNLLEFPEAPPANRELILREILHDIEPDIFMVAELQNEAGAELILNQSLNDLDSNYASAPFALNTSGNAGIQQLLYYNTEKFSLELTDIIQTSIRDINRYQLKAITNQSDSDPILIDCFVAHFKASQGVFNEQIRFEMALEFTDYLNNNLASDANVVFGGDFNFYNSTEDGFLQLFIGNTIIPMNDPINQLGDWHTNSNFSEVHTQSTRESSSFFDGFGAGGGLDDRFDFIFLSANILDPNHEVSYVNDSYQTYGNNSNCYNEDISDNTCGGFYSQDIRNLLWNMSDHLPLVLDLRLDQNFLGLDDFYNQEMLSLSQGNVVGDYLEIEIQPDYLGEIDKLYIYSTFGQIVKIKTVDNVIVSIPTYDLANGVYILKTNHSKPLKFVVSH